MKEHYNVEVILVHADDFDMPTTIGLDATSHRDALRRVVDVEGEAVNLGCPIRIERGRDRTVRTYAFNHDTLLFEREEEA